MLPRPAAIKGFSTQEILGEGRREGILTVIQYSETIATATANPDLIELGLDEMWGLPEHKDRLWEGVL